MRWKCRAALFDLDGVLVDSTPCVEQHWRTWAMQQGLDVEEILKISHGRPTIDTIRIVAPHLSAEAEAEKLDARQATNLSGVREVAGAVSLVASMPWDAWAVVTSGNQAIATNRLHHVGLPVPRVLVTTDEVSHYKPHPEGYLKAAQRLAVAPEQCVVVEDAPVGIKAAHAARMRAIAVTTTHAATELSEADLCVPALVNLSIEPIHLSSSEQNYLEIVVADN